MLLQFINWFRLIILLRISSWYARTLTLSSWNKPKNNLQDHWGFRVCALSSTFFVKMVIHVATKLWYYFETMLTSHQRHAFFLSLWIHKNCLLLGLLTDGSIQLPPEDGNSCGNKTTLLLLDSAKKSSTSCFYLLVRVNSWKLFSAGFTYRR